MIAKFSNIGLSYTLDTKIYDVLDFRKDSLRVYILVGEKYRQPIRAKNLKELKEKLKGYGFVFEGFVIEESVQ